MRKTAADLIEKAATALMEVARERDELHRELSQLKEASDMQEALEGIKPFIPSGRDPEEYLNEFLETGGSPEHIKGASRLLSGIDSGFSVDDGSARAGDGSAMVELEQAVLGEL